MVGLLDVEFVEGFGKPLLAVEFAELTGNPVLAAAPAVVDADTCLGTIRARATGPAVVKLARQRTPASRMRLLVATILKESEG